MAAQPFAAFQLAIGGLLKNPAHVAAVGAANPVPNGEATKHETVPDTTRLSSSRSIVKAETKLSETQDRIGEVLCPESACHPCR